jgi:hypothetical protein
MRREKVVLPGYLLCFQKNSDQDTTQAQLVIEFFATYMINRAQLSHLTENGKRDARRNLRLTIRFSIR